MLVVAFLLSLLGVVFWLAGLFYLAMLCAGFSLGMTGAFVWMRKFPG